MSRPMAARLRLRTALRAGVPLLVLAIAAGCGMIPPEPQDRGRQVGLLALQHRARRWARSSSWGSRASSSTRSFRYRRRDDRLPPQTHGNTLVEIIWTAIPTVIVLILFVLSIVTLQKVEATSDPISRRRRHRGGGLPVAVGSSATWTTTATRTTTSAWSGSPAEPPVMVVPVGEPVRLTLISRDVIHSFFVPAVPDQARPDPVPGGRAAERAGVHGQRGGHLPRPVRRVLRRPPRPDDLQRAGHVARRLRPVAGGRQGRRHAAAVGRSRAARCSS